MRKAAAAEVIQTGPQCVCEDVETAEKHIQLDAAAVLLWGSVSQFVEGPFRLAVGGRLRFGAVIGSKPDAIPVWEAA